LYDYAVAGEGQISLSEGAIVTIHNQDPDGWWNGTLNGNTGIFPGSYVELISDTSAPTSSGPIDNKPITPQNAAPSAADKQKLADLRRQCNEKRKLASTLKQEIATLRRKVDDNAGVQKQVADLKAILSQVNALVKGVRT